MAQPIILRASTLKRKRPVQYVTGYKGKRKAYKKGKGILYVYWAFYINAGGPFLESDILFFLYWTFCLQAGLKGDLLLKKVNLYCKK